MNNKNIRVSALLHEALGTSRVKVIFREGGRDSKREDNETAYWMNRDIYNAIPIMQKATLSDYQKLGKVDQAQNTDIYSNL